MKWVAVFLFVLLTACAEKPYPYPDITQALQARNNAILDQFAAGKITRSEAEDLVAQARMTAIGEETRRNSMNRPAPIQWPVFCSTSYGNTICY